MIEFHFKELATMAWDFFSSIVTILVLALLGLSRKNLRQFLAEHKKNVDYVNDKTSKSAEELKEKKDEDWHEVVGMLKLLKQQNEDIKHDVNAARQENKNLTILLKAKGVI